jgi:hypothetical protein
VSTGDYVATVTDGSYNLLTTETFATDPDTMYKLLTTSSVSLEEGTSFELQNGFGESVTSTTFATTSKKHEFQFK